MKEFAVNYRPEALSDMKEIFEYIIENNHDEIIAKRFINRIFERCEKIGNIPNGGVCRDDLSKNIQLIPFERNIIILYKFENEEIIVVNIIYGGRNYNILTKI